MADGEVVGTSKRESLGPEVHWPLHTTLLPSQSPLRYPLISSHYPLLTSLCLLGQRVSQPYNLITLSKRRYAISN